MKFVMASYGSRGDVEPSAAVGRELQRRGHDVCLAVPPDLVGFIETAGLAAVPYGLDTRAWLEVHREFWTRLTHSFWKIPDLFKLAREVTEPIAQCWQEISTTLKPLAEGADLLFTGSSFEQPAANVAEYYDIPLATYHYIPARPNGQLLAFLPGPLSRATMRMDEWLSWHLTRKLEHAQRRELGLSTPSGPAARRIVDRGALEIQAYDEVCFPGLAAEWAKWGSQRPFVGALTMQLPTDTDDDVAAWIAQGTPPIFFGFGSMPIESPAHTAAMIGAACAQLGERALVSVGWGDISDAPHLDNVKMVGAVNYAAAFPACRAVVHHGGSGTTAAALRAGVPALILWMLADQPYWGAVVKKLKVGTARRFSATDQKSLTADLRTILGPQYAVRAREIAARMTKPADSVASAADLLEERARLKCVR